MDFDSSQLVSVDTNVDAGHGQHRRQHVDPSGGPQVRAGGGRGEAGAARRSRRRPRRAGREPDRRARASSRAAASPSPTAQLLGDKLFNVNVPDDDAERRRRRPAKPVSAVQARRHDARRGSTSRDKVTGTHTYVAQHPGAGHAARPRSSGRAARARTATARPGRLGRRELDQAHRRRAGRAQGNFLGVVAPKEYDAIQAAAQLKVHVGGPRRSSPSNGNLWKQMRAHDAAGKAPARIAAPTGNVDAALASAAKTSPRATRTHYQTHGPIGPTCAIADVTNGQRDRSTRTRRTATRHAPQLAAAARRCRERTIACASSTTRARAPSAARAARRRRRRRRRCSRRLAGTPVRLQFMRWDEHGWDNYGPAHARWTSAAGSTRTARSSRSTHGFGMRPRDNHDADASRRSAMPMATPGRRPGRHDLARGDAVRHRRTAGHRQDDAARLEQLLQDVDAARAERAADVLRVGADDRPARVRGQDGPVSSSGSRTSSTTRPEPVAWTRSTRVAQAANWKPRVAASNLSQTRQRRHRPRRRARRLRRLAVRHRGRDRGEQEDRQDRREAHLRRRRTPASPINPGAGREPDGRAR